MTLRSNAAPAPDPARELEDAWRFARAASHSRRLDTATQAALDALVALGHAACERILQRDAELNEARVRIAALEAAETRAATPGEA